MSCIVIWIRFDSSVCVHLGEQRAAWVSSRLTCMTDSCQYVMTDRLIPAVVSRPQTYRNVHTSSCSNATHNAALLLLDQRLLNS